MSAKKHEAGNPAKSAGPEGFTHQENSTDAPASNLVLTYFAGDELDTTPAHVFELTWNDLSDFLRDATGSGPKGSAGYIVGARVANERDDANCGPATTLIVDYEPPLGTRVDWSTWPCAVIAHSTASHLQVTKKNPEGGERWRVFILLGEPVPGEQYKAVRRALALPVGAKLRSQSQPAFLPTGAPEFVRTLGPALNWRALIANHRPVELARLTSPVVQIDDPSEVNADSIAMMAECWPLIGSRHDAHLALAGLMRQSGVSEDFALEYTRALASATNPSEDAYRHDNTVENTYGKPEGTAQTGATRLLELLRFDEADGFDAALSGRDRLSWLDRWRALSGVLLPSPANDNAAGNITALVDPTTQLADWKFRLQSKENGAIIPSAHNLDATFELHPAWRGVFGFDLLANDVVVLREPPVEGLPAVGKRWTADETHPLTVWLNREMHIQPRDAHIIAAVKNVARRAHSFHPVRDYLRAVQWDGKRRSLCIYLGVKLSRYSVAVCSAWLRSAVARVMRPGCKADLLIILEGPQGARKSSALRALAGDEWFYEASGGAKDKDFAQDMRGKWMAEIPEIDRMLSGRDDSELKAIVSKQVDRYRPSYGRDSHDFPRQVVFGGTTNRDGYLKDGTGNRRYCPLRCGTIDLEGIRRDRDQLWAQAVAEYDAGKRWWLPNNIERRVAVKEQAERLEQDVWEDLTRDWATSQTEPFSTAAALASLPGAKPAATLERRDEMRMASVLRALGCVSRQTGARRVMRWHSPESGETSAPEERCPERPKDAGNPVNERPERPERPSSK